MTEHEQLELQHIRAEQDVLRAQWSRLEERLRSVEAAVRVSTPSPAAEQPARQVPPRPAAVPPPLESAPPRATPVPLQPPPPQPLPSRDSRDSLEMQIGSTWLVRAGIVLLLTSLTFAGNYLYKNIIPHLGPGSKVALLYLAAGALTGLGAWLERSRQAREITGLQNYARVVLAGGLAAIYYVTYAAHYFPKLRIIESALASGLLLMGWAAFMVWLADRRKSEILATLAILLAYYTSAINEIAIFTLWSNLVLSIGAVYLLRRHLWRIFPFATLLATFGSFAFWRLAHLYPLQFTYYDAAVVPVSLWVECSFLSLYWLLFTGTVLTSGERPAALGCDWVFVSVNNGAYFLLVTWLLVPEHPFYRWAFAFGAVLLVISELLSGRLPRAVDPGIRGAYRAMGVLLVTLGIISYFSGWHLSLMLAAETVLLVVGASRGKSALLLLGAIACAGLTTLGAVIGIYGFQGRPWAADAGIGALLLFAAWWCRQLWDVPSVGSADVESVRQPAERTAWNELLAGTPAYFSLLAAAVWFFLLEARLTFPPAVAPVLAGAALALIGLGYLLRLEKLSWSALAYLLVAQGKWIAEYGGAGQPLPPLWNVLAVLAATVAFGCAWKWLTERQNPSVRRLAAGQPLYVLILALGTFCGWRYISSVNPALHVGPFTEAARWSLYAAGVFALGLLVHERVYRWLGLMILLVTLLWVTLFDLWELDLLERALSFLSLGVVLLGIGFLYNRFSAKLRDLL